MRVEPKRYATRSLVALAFIPVSMVLGFVVGSILIGDPNVPTAAKDWDAEWRVVVLWLLISIPPVIGIALGVRAVRMGERKGRLGIILNSLALAFLTLITLVTGSIEAFS